MSCRAQDREKIFITKNVIFCSQFSKTDEIAENSAQLQEADCEQNKAL